MNAIPRAFTWTDENVEALKRGVLDGSSFAEIAAELGATRNACIGKATRLRLAASRPIKVKAERPTLLPATKGQRHSFAAVNAVRAERRRAKAPGLKPELFKPMIIVLDPSSAGHPVTLMDLRDGVCRWPLFDNPKFPVDSNFYCGAACDSSGSYCDHHYRASIIVRAA